MRRKTDYLCSFTSQNFSTKYKAYEAYLVSYSSKIFRYLRWFLWVIEQIHTSTKSLRNLRLISIFPNKCMSRNIVIVLPKVAKTVRCHANKMVVTLGEFWLVPSHFTSARIPISCTLKCRGTTQNWLTASMSNVSSASKA